MKAQNSVAFVVPLPWQTDRLFEGANSRSAPLGSDGISYNGFHSQVASFAVSRSHTPSRKHRFRGPRRDDNTRTSGGPETAEPEIKRRRKLPGFVNVKGTGPLS